MWMYTKRLISHNAHSIVIKDAASARIGSFIDKAFYKH